MILHQHAPCHLSGIVYDWSHSSEWVLLPVGLINKLCRITDNQNTVTFSFPDGDVLIARHPQIHPISEGFFIEQKLGDGIHRQAGIFRIPETDAVDRTTVQILARVLRQADPKDAYLALQTGLFYRSTNADNIMAECP